MFSGVNRELTDRRYICVFIPKFQQGGRGAAVARLIPAMEHPEGHPFKSGRPQTITTVVFIFYFFKKLNFNI